MPTLAPALTAAGIRHSRFGWFAVAGNERAITFVTMGHATPDAVRLKLPPDCPEDDTASSSLVRSATDDLARYFDGEPVDLVAIPVAAGLRTPFQERAVRALRRVPYGQTVSYGELAARAGAPGAARAIGTIMSQNRIPLLIPCHRVVASGGRIGGFSAPQGIELKRALLAMEAGELTDPLPLRR